MYLCICELMRTQMDEKKIIIDVVCPQVLHYYILQVSFSRWFKFFELGTVKFSLCVYFNHKA